MRIDRWMTRATLAIAVLLCAAAGATAQDDPIAEEPPALREELLSALATFCEAASTLDETKIRAARSRSSMKFVDDLFAEMERDIAQAFARMKSDCEELPDFSVAAVEVLREGPTAGLFVARIPEDVPGNIECRLVRFVDEGDGWKYDAGAVVYSTTLEVDTVRYADVEAKMLEVHRINGLIGPR